jgi:hypothetical protein
VAVPPPRPRPREEPIPTVLPAVTFRGQVAELSGSMALAALFALLGTVLWAALNHAAGHLDLRQNAVWVELGTVFFLTVAASWAVLVSGKFWTQRRGDSWTRRLVMMFLGVVIGGSTLWLHGWTLRSVLKGDAAFPSLASYVSYFALAFFALRWWRMADPRRSQRFSFLPLLAAGFWALLPLIVFPDSSLGAVALVMTAAIVQLVSPWEPPTPPSCRRLRLRYS